MASTSDPNTALTENYWIMNTEALDRYAYTFNMPGMEAPVKLQDFKQFFVQFRTDIAAGGGPALDSDVYTV